MIKKFILITLIIAGAISASALNIRDFFISEPGQVFETLQQGTRAAMITMAEQGQFIESENRLGSNSQITVLEQNFMSINTSDKKTVELRMLTSGKDTVIAVVETVQIPYLDSKITFYNDKWQKLNNKKYFKNMPTLNDFIKPGVDKKKAEEALSTIAFPVISMKFIHENHDVLYVEQQLDKFLSKEEYYKVEPYLLKSISYNVVKTSIKASK